MLKTCFVGNQFLTYNFGTVKLCKSKYQQIPRKMLSLKNIVIHLSCSMEEMVKDSESQLLLKNFLFVCLQETKHAQPL